jgi:hypothetical protein
MARLTEVQVIMIMRNEYRSRLQEVLGENDVYDSHGNMVLSPGLKVRHKDSQFEYTVDSITGDKETDDLQIQLSLPDEPRFEPPAQDVPVMIDRPEPGVLGEVDPAMLTGNPAIGQEDELILTPLPDSGSDEEGDVFVIDQEEFEKEYEVK